MLWWSYMCITRNFTGFFLKLFTKDCEPGITKIISYTFNMVMNGGHPVMSTSEWWRGGKNTRRISAVTLWQYILCLAPYGIKCVPTTDCGNPKQLLSNIQIYQYTVEFEMKSQHVKRKQIWIEVWMWSCIIQNINGQNNCRLTLL